MLDAIERRLLEVAPAGGRTLGSGVRLMGHVPVVAPLAFLFTLYPGLEESEIAELGRQLRRPLPTTYQELLRHSNGISIFVVKLSIYGMREGYTREADASRQPFDLVDANRVERPKIPKDAVVIGGYQEDGSHIYMQRDDPRVFWVAPKGGPVLKSWPSLEGFLLLEIDRLHELIGSDYSKLGFFSETNTLPLPMKAN